MGATLWKRKNLIQHLIIYTITLLDGTKTEYVSVGDKNGPRHAPYHRLDLSFTYKFDIGSGKGSMGLSLFNFYNRSNMV